MKQKFGEMYMQRERDRVARYRVKRLQKEEATGCVTKLWLGGTKDGAV